MNSKKYGWLLLFSLFTLGACGGGGSTGGGTGPLPPQPPPPPAPHPNGYSAKIVSVEVVNKDTLEVVSVSGLPIDGGTLIVD